MKYLLIIGGLLVTIGTTAQKSFELSLLIGATNSIITPSFNKDVDLNYDQHISYALIGSHYFTEKAYITSGIRYQPQGATSQLSIVSIEHPEGTGEYKTVHWNAYTIGVPIKWGYRIYSTKRFEISSEIGLISSFVTKQNLTTDISEQELNIYSNFLLSSSVSVRLGLKLSKNYYLILKPNFQYQVNGNNTEALIVDNKKAKLLFYGFDIGVSRNL